MSRTTTPSGAPHTARAHQRKGGKTLPPERIFSTFTLSVYGHLLPRGDRRAVDGLDDSPGATVGNLTATTRTRG